MKKRYAYLMAVGLLLLTQGLSGQDMHYSQFFNAPLLLNPSYTGYTHGNYRVGLNYRDQWRSVTVPFQTFSLFTDASFKVNRTFTSDHFGVGLQALNDQAGDGDLSTTRVFLSTAYHRSMASNDRVIASVGFGLGWVQKRVNFNQLVFDSQWTDNGFNPDLPNNENFETDNINYLDFQAGMHLSIRPGARKEFHIAAALHHIGQIEESFYGISDNVLGMRPVINMGASLGLGEFSAIHPELFYTYQEGAQEITAGANLSRSFPFNKGLDNIYYGAWYRYADAIIAAAGIEFYSTRLMLSYDINVSKLTPGSSGAGGFELSLIYVFVKGDKNKLKCPTL